MCLPFDAVGPVCGTHFAFGDVAGVACFEGFPPFPIGSGFAGLFGGAGDALLSEADGFDLVALFGDNNVGLLRMVGGALRFVVSAYAGSCEPRVFLGCH